MIPIADDVWQLPLTPRNAINAYLIGDVLVDTGIKQSADKIAGMLEGRQISAIALTHAHNDHAGAMKRLADRLGVRLNSRQTSYGHWQLWVPSQPENTTERRLDNRSFLGKIVWGPRLQVDRSFGAGQRLCVKWWRNDKPGSGRWSDRGKACVTISR